MAVPGAVRDHYLREIGSADRAIPGASWAQRHRLRAAQHEANPLELALLAYLSTRSRRY